jgi:hypothetical protein
VIAVIQHKKPAVRASSGFIESVLCVVYLTEREGFAKVTTTTYCGDKHPTGDGILQVSDKILEGALISLPGQPPENKSRRAPLPEK